MPAAETQRDVDPYKAMRPPQRFSSGFYFSSGFVIICILLVAFFLRLHALSAYPPGISDDEAVNLIDATHIAQTGRFSFYQDFGRPEPLFRMLEALGVLVSGNSVWALRLNSALIGLLSVAAAYRATVEILYDRPEAQRRLAGIAAMVILTVAIGHMSLSRSLYRGIPQPFFSLMAIVLVMRALRRGRWRDYAGAGVMITGALLSYTAAYVFPLGFVALGVSLMLFQRRGWRRWLPGLVLMTAVVLMLMLPVIIRVMENPQQVIGRAADLSEGQIDWGKRVQAVVDQFFVEGDENPQYNSANAPLIASGWGILFLIGLGGLVLRLRKPASLMLLALLVLGVIPNLFSGELTHGLRMVGAFVVIPPVIGAGVSLLIDLISPLMGRRVFYWLALLVLVGAGFGSAVQSWRVYADYWDKAETDWRKWLIHDLSFNHGDWFFRTDRRDFADWVKAQEKPLLIPVAEMMRPTTLAWLMEAIESVESDVDAGIPADSWLVIPWELESEGEIVNERQYVLWDQGQVTILAPLDREDMAGILAENGGELIENPNAVSPIPSLGRVIALDRPPRFETLHKLGEGVNFGDGELRLMGWSGLDLLRMDPEALATEDELRLTLYWQALRPMGFEYWSSLQIQDVDFEIQAGTDVQLLARLYPSTLWEAGGEWVPVTYVLSLNDSADFETGLYRLATSVYRTFGGSLKDEQGQQSSSFAWLKVGDVGGVQAYLPYQESEQEIIFGGSFRLVGSDVQEVDDQLRLRLSWRSLVDRPEVDATLFVHVLDAEGQILQQIDQRPMLKGELYPTFVWDADEVVQTVYEFPVNEGATQFRVGMYVFPGPQNLKLRVDGEEQAEDFILLPVGRD